MKKRQAQDSTRKYDVAPLRRRIEQLERDAKGTKKFLARLKAHLAKAKLQKRNIIWGE